MSKKEIADLREYAKSQGIEVPPRISLEKLKMLISDTLNEKAYDGPEKKEEPAPVPKSTEDEILAAIKPIMDAKQGFVAKFDENCWYFSYRGKEDSGNLQMPIRVIKNYALLVSGGARVPAVHKEGNITTVLV